MELRYSDELVSVYLGDARNLNKIKDNEVHLIFTSPPYNVGMEYDNWNDRLSRDEYNEFMRQWLKEAYRVLYPGGRLAVNVPAFLKPTKASVYSFLVIDLYNIATDIGFLPYDWLTWEKVGYGGSAGERTNWGSWLSQSAPSLRSISEYILIFSKEKYKLDPRGKKSDLTRSEFLELTKNVWHINPSSSGKSRKIHPAPFPLELAYKIIKLFSFPEDLVLDPFAGIGTTLIAAKILRRKAIGVEISPKYVEICSQNLAQILEI